MKLIHAAYEVYIPTEPNPNVIPYMRRSCALILSPLFASLLVPLPPVQAALAIQQVHVAAGSLLLAAYHSAVQPLASPLYVTQEMLDCHILGRARAHGREEDSGACVTGSLLQLT